MTNKKKNNKITRRFNNIRKSNMTLTKNAASDVINKVNYIPLSRDEEREIIKIVKMYYYKSATDDMKEIYLGYYFEVYPNEKIKYDSDPLEKKEIIIEKAISNAKYYREKFIENNQLLIKSIAGRFCTTIPLEDALQIGNLGLIRALEKFDLEAGTKFSTYATWWIYQSITRYIDEHSSTIEAPVHLLTIAKKIHKAEDELLQSLCREPTLEEISKFTEIPMHKVKKAMNYKRYQQNIESLDISIGERENKSLLELIGDADIFTNYADDELFFEGLMDIIDSIELSDRERRIIVMRFGLDDGRIKTLEEVRKEFGITKERVRQIESKTLVKLRKNEKLNSYYKSNHIHNSPKISELTYVRELISKCDLSILNEAEFQVINLIYGQLYSVNDVSTKTGMTERKVFRIKDSALTKLNNYYVTTYGENYETSKLKK